MKELSIRQEQIEAYGAYLRGAERSDATIEKYLRSVSAFSIWLGDR